MDLIHAPANPFYLPKKIANKTEQIRGDDGVPRISLLHPTASCNKRSKTCRQRVVAAGGEWEVTVKVFNFLLVRFNHIDLLRLTKEHHCRDLPVKRVLKGS